MRKVRADSAFLSLFFILVTSPLVAWDGHFLLTFAALKDFAPVKQESMIRSESLDSFVEEEKQSLTLLLKDYEKWAEENITSYPPLPEDLVFDGKASSPHKLRQKFLLSLRVNPDLSYPNFVLYPPGTTHRIAHSFSDQEKASMPLSSLFALKVSEPVIEKVLPNEAVSALEILVAASEEVDHGTDIGLWEDSDTWYGDRMGMGAQPFGNEAVAISSQAPMHMGYFHEPPLVYRAVSWLNRCYPEYRISLFMALSRHAMASGHRYWGYRFLGWAIHYIQDLTQPYHAKMAPGTTYEQLLGLQILENIGITEPLQNMRQLLSNRHFAFENFEYSSLNDPHSNRKLLATLADVSYDRHYQAFDLKYPRKIVAFESFEEAEYLNELLLEAMPSLYVDDPDYIFGEDENLNMREIVWQHDKHSAQKLDSALLAFMAACGAHTRNAIKFLFETP